MSYDKAKYHFESVQKEGLDMIQAYVHSGFYLGWLIDNDLLDEEFADDCDEDITLFKRREITAPRLFQRLDGVLSEQDISEQGNAFTQSYFDFDTGSYLEDYQTYLVKALPGVFHVKDSWENYHIAAEFISERYRRWLSRQANVISSDV